MTITSTNPATAQILQRFDEHTPEQVEAKLQAATRAFRAYRHTSFAARASRMQRAAEILRAEKQHFGRMMTEEMGKTLKSAVAEAEKCALACRHYAENAEKYLRDEPVSMDDAQSYVRFLPLGAVLAVMPWNFPFWQVIRFAAPTLMAGNVGLLKHASNVPRCALALEDLFLKAGFEPGVFQTLLIGSRRVAPLIEDERVAAVTLTGSEPAGVEVAGLAGRKLKKSVLELGGSDPFIVMPSADIETAVKTAVVARNLNNGQSCIAAKRFIVHSAVYDEFARRLTEQVAALRVGDPMAEGTDIGPLATREGVTSLAEQVERSVAAGAKLLTGGRVLEGAGYFYTPSVLAEIPESAPVYRDEVFGPVALLFKVSSIEEAIELANDSTFGLGSSVWTRDAAEQQKFIDEIEAGQTFVNAMVASDPRLPFGGIKHSGYGRELGSYGIREFVNAKSVLINGAKRAASSESE
ncbi:MAG TPA: NAD-dependent succinate-semialdehyde dehydrogenase [Polyangiales bacterium]|nr:NAD-dependent succinate-semialdehyde dehydrogenase [Polyangiales bacterium]